MSCAPWLTCMNMFKGDTGKQEPDKEKERQTSELAQRTSAQETAEQNNQQRTGGDGNDHHQYLRTLPLDEAADKETFRFKDRDDFEEILVLGKGAFAKIVLAKHKASGQYVALKIVDKKLILAQKRASDARAERDVMMRLRHNYLMQLHGTFQSVHKLFFVLDFQPGGDLEEYIRKQPSCNLDFETARLYSAEVFSAMSHLHKNGVIYRDLKPENILMSQDGHIILADFGLSKDFGPDGDYTQMVATSFVGSPLYVAPEVLRKDPYTQAVDYWSFGILLYRMVYGRPPFMGKNMREVFDQIQNEEPKFPPRPVTAGPLPTVEKNARNLICALLVKAPVQRMTEEAVRSHPFFTGLSWEAVEKKEVKPRHWKQPPTAAERVEAQEKRLDAKKQIPSDPASPSGDVMYTPAVDAARPLDKNQQKNFEQFSCNRENYKGNNGSNQKAE